jgi:hypothetical protein
MRTDGEPADFFYQLDDPAFLAERARVRSRLEHVPENALGRPGLERLYEAMTEEFCRRARLAWTRSRLATEDHADRVSKAVGHVIGLECRQRPRSAAMQPDAGQPYTAGAFDIRLRGVADHPCPVERPTRPSGPLAAERDDNGLLHTPGCMQQSIILSAGAQVAMSG